MLTVASAVIALTRVRGTHWVNWYATTEGHHHLALLIYRVLLNPFSDKLVQETAVATHLATSLVLRLCGLSLVANKAAWRLGWVNVRQGNVVVVQTGWMICSTIASLFISTSKASHDNLMHTVAASRLIATIIQQRHHLTTNLAYLPASSTDNWVSTVAIDLSAAFATKSVRCVDLRRWRATFTQDKRATRHIIELKPFARACIVVEDLALFQRHLLSICVFAMVVVFHDQMLTIIVIVVGVVTLRVGLALILLWIRIKRLQLLVLKYLNSGSWPHWIGICQLRLRDWIEWLDVVKV